MNGGVGVLDGHCKGAGKGRLVCISYKEDLDGIGAAALVKQAYGGDTVLVDCRDMAYSIGHVAASVLDLERLFVCDVGLNGENWDDFMTLMKEMHKRCVSITYVDYHAVDADVVGKLSDMGVRAMHDTNECASVRAYESFKSDMSDHATFIAACAAVSDYMDDRPAGGRFLTCMAGTSYCCARPS